MDNAVTLIQPAKSKTFARTLPKVVMDIPKIDADEIEKRLRTPANNYWQKFYRGHCASITKQEQELNKEIEQLNELIRYWKNKAAYAPSKTKGRK